MGIQSYLAKQLRADEEIVVVIRTSLVHYRRSLLLLVAGLVLDVFFFYPLLSVGTWGIALFLGVLLVVALGIARIAYLWSYNIFVLTNQRLIDVDQRGFLERHVAECPLQHIQDIRYTSRGWASLVFGVGTVVVDSGSLRGHIELVDVAAPDEVKEQIMNEHHNHIKNDDARQGI